jgi:hypothetical protein
MPPALAFCAISVDQAQESQRVLQDKKDGTAQNHNQLSRDSSLTRRSSFGFVCGGTLVRTHTRRQES